MAYRPRASLGTGFAQLTPRIKQVCAAIRMPLTGASVKRYSKGTGERQKMNRKQFLSSMLASTIFGGRAEGQPKVDLPSAATGEKNAASDALHVFLQTTENRVMAVAEAMPSDSYGFVPIPSLFASGSHTSYAGVRTFAGQLAHLAGGNYYFFAPVMRLAMPISQEELNKATAKPQAIAVVRESFAFGYKAIETITPESAFNVVQGHEGMNTPATLIAAGVEHAANVYGQLIEYVRMNGLLPPGSK